jgi:hypothetical protein
MEETKEFLKKYWPYLLGGVIGLYIIMKYMGSGSSSTSAAPAIASAGPDTSLQQAQLGLAAQAQQAQINAQAAQLQAQVNAANGQLTLQSQALDVQNSANYASAFNQFQNTQANMATAIGGAASQVVTALNQPAITALQAGAYENSAALQAAGNVAAQSFLAQGQVSQGTSAMFGKAISNLGSLGQFNAPQPPGPVGSAVNTGIRAYAAYQTMGGSEAFNSASGGGLYGNGGSSSSMFGGSPGQSTGYNPALNTSSLGTYNPTGY